MEFDELNPNKPVVVVTGFGDFRDFSTDNPNPSWEAVKRIQLSSGLQQHIQLVKLKIPVVYEDVNQFVNTIWSKYRPALVVHCGVGRCSSPCITLEKRAVINLDRYCSRDMQNCVPKMEQTSSNTNDNSCDCPPLQYLYTRIPLEPVVKAVKENSNERCVLSAEVSEKAGEYLCEYIYRCSLLKDPTRTLFIHVPVTSKELTYEIIANTLEVALEALLSLVGVFTNRT